MMIELPTIPVPFSDLVKHIDNHGQTQSGVHEALKPYMVYESKLREVFAQEPKHPAISQNHLVPLFAGPVLTTRARDLAKESNAEKDQYLLPLSDKTRRGQGKKSIVGNLKDFRTNFNVFSESSLVDIDWNNVVAAGSSVLTPLLPVDHPHNESKRALRNYYHEILAPASDVDLFIYGLNEEQAIEKIRQIETRIRDSILSETTTVRTKNTITIVSQYPTRHVQIVLRLYKSVSEILTGFDVDCSCVAYDGKQVWASPRAVAALMTQVNTIDLTRRSPSYENRLSKYAHRGFEVSWPGLDRSRIDPTIYERSFSRVLGLARLLVLEKLPLPNDRDNYLAKRREERGRPPLPTNVRNKNQLAGNLKDSQPDDIAEWVDEDDVSNYHTVTIPYGPKYNAKRIEKLLFKKDLLLNAEWNRSKDRKTKLHRHPAFFGFVDDVIHDCCGFCPEPRTDEDLAAAEEEAKTYISGDVKFIRDDPGRQSIGSFNPITDDDWTEMAYVGNTARLCQAIVDKDLEAVIDWFESGELEVVDVNRRDHAGRTPLQLATMCSTAEIVQCLIDRGARIVSRLYNGMTALHIAAYRGEMEMVRALLDKSEANEAEENRREELRKEARRATAGLQKQHSQIDVDMPDSQVENSEDEDMDDDEDEDDNDDDDDNDGDDAMTEGSFVKVQDSASQQDVIAEEDKMGPDVYDIDTLAWDNPVSPLHLAILAGRLEVIKLLLENYSADVLLPVKIQDSYSRTPQAAILSIMLAFNLSVSQANDTIKVLLQHGATATQADMKEISALHYAIAKAKTLLVDTLSQGVSQSLMKVVNHVVVTGYQYRPEVDTPLLTAIRTGQNEIVQQIMSLGATPEVDFSGFVAGFEAKFGKSLPDPEQMKKNYQKAVEQPIVQAAKMQMVEIVDMMVDMGVDVNTLPKEAYTRLEYRSWGGEDKSLLDIIQDHLKELRGYSGEQPKEEKVTLPEPLPPNLHNIPYKAGTYQHWVASMDIEHAKSIKTDQMVLYKRELAGSKAKSEANEEAKRLKIKDTISKLASLETKLIRKGAKTFYEIHPSLKQSNEPQRYYGFAGRQYTDKTEPYKTNLSFLLSDLTDTKKETYFKLYEAVWNGDIATVKALCLSGPSPLQVAVQDLAGFSPFSLAVVRGHEELATLILEIATVQYKPKDDEAQYRYSLRPINDPYSDYDSDYDSEADARSDRDDDLRIFSELVDDKYTVEDISTLADNVKSRVSPMTMLCWDCELWRVLEPDKSEIESKEAFMPAKKTLQKLKYYNMNFETWPWFYASFDDERKRCRWSLVRYAILKDNMILLKYLIRQGSDLASRKNDPDAVKTFTISQFDFTFAIRLGRTDLIGEIIKSTGAAMPLQKMVQKSGVKLEEKPRYYQGLSVHGKKRSDWAERGRGARTVVENEHTPLLAVAFEGNAISTQYYISHEPLRKYHEFAESFKADKRIQSLAQAKGGIDGALVNWLGSRTELAVHMAVMSKPSKDGTNAVLDLLLQVMPQSIDAKSKTGTTPLQLAFELGRYYSAKTLILAGAYQTTKNKLGENLLHTILKTSGSEKPHVFKSLLSLLDQKLIPHLLLERCSNTDAGAVTPLAMFLQLHNGSQNVLENMSLILSHSQGKDLEIMSGAGEYPLHYVVVQKRKSLIKKIVEIKPELLHWENATGMTPYDIMDTQWLRECCNTPPSIAGRTNWSISRESASAFVNDVQNSSQKAEDEEGPSEVIDILKLLGDLATASPGKRKLVTLFDANEVAKRLALQQQKAAELMQQRYLNQNDSPLATEEQDEVTQWFARAKAFWNWQQVKWRQEVKEASGDMDDDEDIDYDNENEE